jgi:hypothetical protein
MVRKKTEGNEEQRRAAARRTRQHGVQPSALSETTGASKQREHLPRHEPHDEKLAAAHQGKQRWQAIEARLGQPGGPGWNREFGPGSPEYAEEHEQVVSALAAAQGARGGEGVYRQEIARRAALPPERVRELLHDLTTVHRLVTQLEGADSPDLGPRFEIKPRL